MKLVPLNTLFNVKYGNSFDLNVLEICDKNSPDKVNYVSRTRENNGVSAFVHKLSNKKPFKAGLITVAGSGNSVLESFLQPLEFYTGYHVFVLTSKKEMTEIEKFFYCYCIRRNQYKYNFGRQANKTLKDLLVPSEITKEFKIINLENFKAPNKDKVVNNTLNLNERKWNDFNLLSLFKVSSSKDTLISNYDKGKTPYITSTAFNNGVTNYVSSEPTNNLNTITINRGGSVGEAFYQSKPYLATPVDVRILTPKFNLNKYIGLFFTIVLKYEKYRFNYSRKMGTGRLKKLSIKLPVDSKGEPDWKFMEDYIKSLPYSSNI